MRRIAAEVGYSETAFAMPMGDSWRVRYFSPESEVPFCGHATIALGAALAQQQGDGVFPLILNNAEITVEGRRDGDAVSAALQSPPTRSEPISDALLSEVLAMFGYTCDDLNPDLPPARAHGGADHLVLTLNSREALAAMHYDLDSRTRTDESRRPDHHPLRLGRNTAPAFTPAILSPRAASTKTRPPAPPPQPLPVTCATSTGHTAAASKSSRAKTWAAAHAYLRALRMYRAAQSACQEPLGSLTKTRVIGSKTTIS